MDMEPPTDVESLRSQVATLQAELDSLRARYDTLLEAKTRAAERYKADYKKWRNFGQWLFPDAETDSQIKSYLKSGKLPACMRPSALGKRKQPEECDPLDQAVERDHETEDRKQESICNSEAGLFSPLTAAASRKQRRKSYHGESSPSVLSPSSESNKPSLPPLSTNLDEESPVDDKLVPCKAELPRPVPVTEPRKGRGRYAQAQLGLETINSRFSIRKDRNNGLDYQYDAVVRNRQERRRMLGSDCECCHEYYQAVGPLPASRQPLWRTPTKPKVSYKPHVSDNEKENTDELEEHKKLISRHRHHWHRPKTPPGYWDIGFPDTQEVLDINRRAAEMHQRKLSQVEAEAKNSNGRYIERTPRGS